MTEGKWLDELPEFLSQTASDRKLRLFTTGCCRLVWDQFTDPRSRHAIEIAEKHADSLVDDNELRLAGVGAYEAYLDVVEAAGYDREDVEVAPESVDRLTYIAYATTHEVDVASSWAFALRWVLPDAWALQDRLQDVFGNSFHPVPIDRDWLAWQDRAIPKLAQAAYDERELPSGHLDVGRIAILADALEEAGCTNAVILSHLRGPGQHVRGCWAVDLLLSKE